MQTKSELANQSMNQILNNCWHWFKMGLIAGACMLATAQYAIRSLPKTTTQTPAPTVSTEGSSLMNPPQGPTLAPVLTGAGNHYVPPASK